MNPDLNNCCAVRIATGACSASNDTLECTVAAVFELRTKAESTICFPSGSGPSCIRAIARMSSIFAWRATPQRLLDGWYEFEGVFGNKYRWIGKHAAGAIATGEPRLRSGCEFAGTLSEGHPVELSRESNGRTVGQWKLERSGLFIVEADLPDGDEYRIDIQAGAVLERCLPTTASLQ